jgi:hypothetical protein
MMAVVAGGEYRPSSNNDWILIPVVEFDLDNESEVDDKYSAGWLSAMLKVIMHFSYNRSYS